MNTNENYLRKAYYADERYFEIFNDKELRAIYDIATDCALNKEAKYKGKTFKSGSSLYHFIFNNYKIMKKREKIIYEELENIKINNNGSDYYKEKYKNLNEELNNIIVELSQLN